MKRKLFLLLMIALLNFAMVNSALAAPAVTLDKQVLTFDVPPVIEQGRTLVPLRAIFEQLGAEVEWDGATRTVTATEEDITIKLTIDSADAFKNDSLVKLDVPAKIKKGRTLVPLRFVSEALGAYVGWDGTTQEINIFKNPPEMFTVGQVLDSTTVELDNGEKVSLLGLEYPDQATAGEGDKVYQEAVNSLKSLLEGKKIWLKGDKEQVVQEGNTPAYVFTEAGLFINARLIADGQAQVKAEEGNELYKDTFSRLQNAAKLAKKGLWGVSVNIPLPTKDGKVPGFQLNPAVGSLVGKIGGTHYHLATCRHAEDIAFEEQVWFANALDANIHGYTPCIECKPPVS